MTNHESLPQYDVAEPQGQAPSRWLVGVGASAGGLESLERFFAAMPDDLGCSFVVVQHLSPNYETMMDHLLARRTRMPVSIAKDGQALLANCIYVIPPKKDMVARNGRLVLTDQAPDEMPHVPIDRFFESMANECRENCAAVVLSGTGSDGSRGAQLVRSLGGLVLCESEATAKFSGMPRSAQATGCVDYVLAPENMSAMLQARIQSHVGRREESTLVGPDWQAIFHVIRERCQIDFSNYKPTTIARRVQRRMKLRDIDTLSTYVNVLRKDVTEVDSLYTDMLIGVTRFFRDPSCFEQLEREVLPGLVANADIEHGVRIWVAGCATGEEAYSLAILLDEIRARQQRAIDIKVLATDIHPGSLRTASRGVYDEEKTLNVSADRLDRYFVRRGDHYEVIPALRQMVVFTPHNLLADPPFIGLDMVSCRNLLIYLDGTAQRQAITLFHFGLKHKGILFLGPSETPGGLGDEFEVVDERCRVFAKRRQARLPSNVRLPFSFHPQVRADRWGPAPSRDMRVKRVAVHDVLLDSVMPPTILTNGSLEVIEVYGGAEKYLRFRRREVSTSILDLVPEALKASLSVGLRRADQSGDTVRLARVQVEVNDSETRDILLQITPLQMPAEGTRYFAIRMDGTTAPRIVGETAVDASSDGTAHAGDATRMTFLEGELRQTREHLQSTIEELEASNEELQATNEELISSNEELQSTNEELNSVNEELHTVNMEYQAKNAELRELNEDLNHVLASTDIGTVFLDENLAIRRFTPRIASVFRLEAQDLGRPITAFSHSLMMDDLHELLGNVLRSGEPVQREVFDKSSVPYYLRILPYRIGDAVRGLVLTLTDISQLIATRNLAKQYQQRLQEAIDAVPVFVAYVNRELRYEYVNQMYTTEFGLQPAQIIGRSLEEVFGTEFVANRHQHLIGVMQGQPQSFEQQVDTAEGRKAISVNYVPRRNSRGEVEGFYVAATDVTSMKKTEEDLAEAVEAARRANLAKSEFLAKMSHEIRSPMTAIIGFADVLDQQLHSPDDQNCVDVIRHNGYHLLQLINDLLDLSRIESGNLHLANDRFDPVDVLKECFNSTLLRAEENKVDLQLQLHESLGETLIADRRRFRQIVLNLVGNAIKFSAEGTVSIRARHNYDKQRLVVTVADNGEGISQQDRKALFQPFSQVDNSDVRAHEGSGLGLAITRQLTDQMGGTITLRSKPGVGSVFRVVLPWRRTGDAESSDECTSHSDAVKLRARGSRLDGRDILVIDDRRDIRFIAEHILRGVGAHVDVAADGLEGIENARRKANKAEPYDCIVTDIQMPHMDGYETTRRLRDVGFTGPILALTANAMAKDREECLSVGCDAFLSKPIDRTELVETIAGLLDRGRTDTNLERGESELRESDAPGV